MGHYLVSPNNDQTWKVEHVNRDYNNSPLSSYVVTIRVIYYECSCLQRIYSGLPCSHEIAVCHYCRGSYRGNLVFNPRWCKEWEKEVFDDEPMLERSDGDIFNEEINLEVKEAEKNQNKENLKLEGIVENPILRRKRNDPLGVQKEKK